MKENVMLRISSRHLIPIAVLVLVGMVLPAAPVAASTNKWAAWGNSQDAAWQTLQNDYKAIRAAEGAGNLAAAEAGFVRFAAANVAYGAFADSPSKALNKELTRYCVDGNTMAWDGYLAIRDNSLPEVKVFGARVKIWDADWALASKIATSAS